MLARLIEFSVANNMLSGPVPLFNDQYGSGFPPESYANNDGLCGAPLEPCRHQHYLRSFISGFAEGWATFTVLAVVISSFCMHTTKQKQQALANRLIRRIRMEDYQIDMLEKITGKIDLEELSEAICNFAETGLIGTGRMGETYKASLPNGCFLAIKRLHISHSHCHTRLKIAVGIARGLAWLHHNNMAHRGLTTKCILLDEDFEPRLSNFGQAKFVNPIIESSVWKNLVSSSTQIPESDCYEKDVHDLGTLLLQLIEQRDSNGFPQNNGYHHYPNDEDELLKFLEVVNKCLMSDPDERPTAQEVYLTLESILEGSHTNPNHIDDAAEIVPSEITETSVAIQMA